MTVWLSGSRTARLKLRTAMTAPSVSFGRAALLCPGTRHLAERRKVWPWEGRRVFRQGPSGSEESTPWHAPPRAAPMSLEELIASLLLEVAAKAPSATGQNISSPRGSQRKKAKFTPCAVRT